PLFGSFVLLAAVFQTADRPSDWLLTAAAPVGSFALLLALALAVYSFVAGVLALARPASGIDRLGETARRAGIAVWGTVTIASLCLLVAAFTNNYSLAYIFHHTNRDLPGPYK